LKAFFAQYPEHKKRAFYVSGESYGGVYVPTLSLKIFEDPSVDWNMQGFLVGNGVFDWNLLDESRVAFLYGHGAISTRQKAKIDEACKGNFGEPSKDCERLMDAAMDNVKGLNVYDYYRDCFQSAPVSAWHVAQQPDLLKRLREAPRPPHPALGMNVPCIDSVGGTEWLGRADVRAALHIESSLPAWEICSGNINYTRDMTYSAPKLYAKMAEKYRILVYNGDTDMACDYLSDSWAVDSINVTVDPDMDWVPWYMTDGVGQQTVGFVTRYQTSPELYFLTVKGAGHMVPQWKPAVASTMLERFLNKKNMRTGEATYSREIVV